MEDKQGSEVNDPEVQTRIAHKEGDRRKTGLGAVPEWDLEKGEGPQKAVCIIWSVMLEQKRMLRLRH